MWETVKIFSRYEVLSEHPDPIRDKQDGSVLVESLDDKSFVCVRLFDWFTAWKHILITMAFLPHNDPDEHGRQPNRVKHLNGNILDNRLVNLEWYSDYRVWLGNDRLIDMKR